MSRMDGKKTHTHSVNRQDGSVAVDGSGDLARWVPSAVSEIQTNRTKMPLGILSGDPHDIRRGFLYYSTWRRIIVRS